VVLLQAGECIQAEEPGCCDRLDNRIVVQSGVKMKQSENNFMPKILVVDDEPQIARVLRAAFASHGYLPHVAADGVEGMIAAREWQPNLVIADVSMPKMNGIEFCRQLREISEIPIIVLSALTNEHTKIEALDAGADDYLTKPFSIQELHARVRGQLRRHPPNESGMQHVLVVGDFRIDVPKHRIIVRDQIIRLTPLEFDLLLCFAKHAGQVLTHRAILQDVWGIDDDRPEYLRVSIGQLRKKIVFSDNPQYILTEPSIGYRFCASGKDNV
jgi:two-component system KDP operon response regulator KdpE